MKKVLIEEPNRSQICLADVDWTHVFRANPALAQSMRLERISIVASNAQALSNTPQSLAQKILLEKDEPRRSGLVLEYVKAVTAAWTEGQLTTDEGLGSSLSGLGMDSCAAFTLKIQIEANLQVALEVSIALSRMNEPSRLHARLMN